VDIVLPILAGTLRVSLFVAALTWLDGCYAEERRASGSETRRKDEVLNREMTEILKSSVDQGELQQAAVALAQSGEAADLTALRKALGSESFLVRLDEEADYEGSSRDLRLARVLKALADNRAPEARSALLALTESEAFLDHPARIDLLIDAWAEVRPPPPQAVAFWDRYSQPDDGFAHRTMMRLTENGTPEAIELIEKKMGDSKHSDDDKIYWSHRHILELRDDPVMLKCCERLLQGGTPIGVRPHVVEALFDYQPKEWYSPHDVAKLPDREKASDEVLRRLKTIGQYALDNIALTDGQRGPVEAEIERIDERLG
jgi:hypothetical protein